MELDGKRVVVTGGSSGIGWALAEAFEAQGAHVVVTGRSADRLAQRVSGHAGIEFFVADVTDDAAVQALRDHVVAGGGVDLLINNAGVFHTFDVTSDYPLAEQLREIDIDVQGPVRVVHHFLPHLLQRDSVLVNVSSGLAYVPLSMAPVYSASKAFVHAWTRSLRAQLAGTSVRVVELLPPVVDTPMVSQLPDSFSKMSTGDLVAAFLKGLRSEREEITPGQASQLRLLNRLAPGFIFRQINQQPRG